MLQWDSMFRPEVKYNPYFSGFYVLATATAFYLYGWTWWWVAAYAVHFVIFAFGVGFGIHRVVIHRSVNVNQWVKRTAALVGVLSNTGSPVTWGTSHYLHHAYPDTEKDPHTPILHSYKLLLGWYNTEEIMKSYKKVFTSLRPIVSDKYLVGMHNYFYLILFAFYGLMFLIGGLKGFLFLGVIPSGLSFFGIILTNFFNHGEHGYRNFENRDQSNNVPWLWFVTFGENWHNNHHKAPSNPTNKLHWWELDPIYFFCWLFEENRWLKTKIFFKKLSLRLFSRPKDYIY